MGTDMRTACYARYSSEMQRETSIEDQLRICREHAAREGWTWQPEHLYTDPAISGSSIEGRPGIQALLSASTVRPRPFDLVLVDDSSRISRDLPDALRVLQRLRFEGVRVLYLAQQIDSANEQAETLVAVHGLVDALYLREMAAKIRRGHIGQFERGFSTGRTCFGYRAVPVLDPSGRLDPKGRPALLGMRVEINETEAPVVRQIFEWYAAGIGVPSIVRRLNEAGIAGRHGLPWRYGGVRGLLKNERVIGRVVWGQHRVERRPGTRQKVFRPVPRADWRIVGREDQRIISDELWAAVEARRASLPALVRQPGKNLMRGKSGALHSPHLFSGFLRCGTCGGAITIVTGGYGTPRYGCVRHSKNGDTVCTNRLTIRARIADAALLKGLQAELLRPETVSHITEQLSTALNDVADRRPQERAGLESARAQAQQKLDHLIAMVETWGGSQSTLNAIKTREAEVADLDRRLAEPEEPIAERLAVIPTWVRQQLEDAAALLRQGPERAKAEFQRLGLRFTIYPVRNEGQRPFMRAEGSGRFEHLAFSRFTNFTTSGQTDLRSAR